MSSIHLAQKILQHTQPLFSYLTFRAIFPMTFFSKLLFCFNNFIQKGYVLKIYIRNFEISKTGKDCLKRGKNVQKIMDNFNRNTMVGISKRNYNSWLLGVKFLPFTTHKQLRKRLKAILEDRISIKFIFQATRPQISS